MMPLNVKNVLEKQHYSIVGKHSAVQICRWTKKSIRNEGACYKEKFYGIKSHLCCQMSPSIMWCQNSCLHCWRAVEYTIDNKLGKKIDSPKKIIEGCIKAQKKLLEGFKVDYKSKKKQLSKADMKKWEEAQEPMHFAISLSGEPTLYEKIGELISKLREMKKTSFLVTNGLHHEKLLELKNKNQLPTQLYISVNASNKKLYDEIHRSSVKDAWEKLNETLGILPAIKTQTRTVFRINLIKDLNMNDKSIKEFALLIKKSEPMFTELKGYMAVGFARERLGYDRMPRHEDVRDFANKLVKELEDIQVSLKILDEHERSCVVVLGKKKEELKIKKI